MHTLSRFLQQTALNLLLLIWVVLDPVVIVVVVVVVVVEACFLRRSLNFSCRVVVSLSLEFVSLVAGVSRVTVAVS